MEYSIFTQAIFLVLPPICLILLGLILYRAFRKGEASNPKRKVLTFLGIVVGWMLLLSLLSLSGFLSDFSGFPPRMMIVLIIPLISLLLLLRFGRLNSWLVNVSPASLLLLQVFRLPVEIGLLLLYLDGQMPVQMTFEGLNFDVITAISAPLFAYLAFGRGKTRYTWAIAWNILGLLLLITVVTIALLSMPTPMRAFMEGPSTAVASQFPYVFLPGVLVPLAYYLHILSLKQLLQAKRLTANSTK